MEKTKKIKQKNIGNPKISMPVIGKFYTTPALTDGDSLVIKLPKAVGQYINNVDNKMYWTVVNGVIQISGNEPNIVIPMIGFRPETFIPQN